MACLDLLLRLLRAPRNVGCQVLPRLGSTRQECPPRSLFAEHLPRQPTRRPLSLRLPGHGSVRKEEGKQQVRDPGPRQSRGTRPARLHSESFCMGSRPRGVSYMGKGGWDPRE